MAAPNTNNTENDAEEIAAPPTRRSRSLYTMSAQPLPGAIDPVPTSALEANVQQSDNPPVAANNVGCGPENPQPQPQPLAGRVPVNRNRVRRNARYRRYRKVTLIPFIVGFIVWLFR